MALITVLLLLSAVGLLAAAAAVLCRYTAVETMTATAVTRERYRAESTLNRVVYLLQQDIRRFPARTLGEVDYNDTLHVERWMADSVERELELGDEIMHYRILDATGGDSIAGDSPRTELVERFLPARKDWNTEENDDFLTFLTRLDDYIDADDNNSLRGMEAQDYRHLGIPALPRNGIMQFREEILWVPNAGRYLPPEDGQLRQLMVIAPAELDAPERVDGKRNLFAVPLSFIVDQCDLDDNEERKVQQALEDWRNLKKPLTDSLELPLQTRLAEQFSLVESGTYVIDIQTGSPERLGASLTVTLKMAPGLHFLEFYEHFFYQ